MLDTYKDIITTKDLCQILHISKTTAYELLQSGEIPAKKIGHVYKIKKESVIKFMAN